MKCLYYKSDSYNPYENLAVEEFLFETLPTDTFVFYLWQNARTVVIGRNQNAYLECQIDALLSDGGKLARRNSGGGAVYHDKDNLNFTFIFNKENYDLQKDFKVISEALKEFDIKAEISGRNDITVDGKKISGNAFLNIKNKVCHHGTLLVNVDTEKMAKYLKVDVEKLLKNGVKSVKSRVANLKDLSKNMTIEGLSEALVRAIQKVFRPEIVEYILIPNLIEKVQRLSSDEHLFGANASFISKASERFSWGKADVGFEIKGDKLEQLDIYTDSLETEAFVKIIEDLKNKSIGQIKNMSNENNIYKSDIISLIMRNI
ncbi:MAG: lipoate--protein ligase [Clostridia bacterium]